MQTKLIFNELTQKYEAEYPSRGPANPLVTESGVQSFANKSFTGQVLGADGTSALPAYSFTTEPTLGIWRVGSGIIQVQGSQVITGSFLQLASTAQFSWSTRALLLSGADGQLAISNAANTSFSTLDHGPSGGALTSRRIQKKITSVADSVATTMFTVTVPNASHSAAIRLMFVASTGGTDAFESSRAASGMVVLARTAGVDCVATAIALHDAGIATVGSGGTITLAYGLTAMSGASSTTQTFTITVTLVSSGTTGLNQCMAIAETLNSDITGVTIA